MMKRIDRNTLRKAVTIEFPLDTTHEFMLGKMEYIARKTGMIVNYVFEESGDHTLKYSKAMIDRAIKKSIERYNFNERYFWDHLNEEEGK